jgi:hypothetical protein
VGDEDEAPEVEEQELDMSSKGGGQGSFEEEDAKRRAAQHRFLRTLPSADLLRQLGMMNLEVGKYSPLTRFA